MTLTISPQAIRQMDESTMRLNANSLLGYVNGHLWSMYMEFTNVLLCFHNGERDNPQEANRRLRIDVLPIADKVLEFMDTISYIARCLKVTLPKDIWDKHCEWALNLKERLFSLMGKTQEGSPLTTAEMYRDINNLQLEVDHYKDQFRATRFVQPITDALYSKTVVAK